MRRDASPRWAVVLWCCTSIRNAGCRLLAAANQSAVARRRDLSVLAVERRHERRRPKQQQVRCPPVTHRARSPPRRSCARSAALPSVIAGSDEDSRIQQGRLSRIAVFHLIGERRIRPRQGVWLVWGNSCDPRFASPPPPPTTASLREGDSLRATFHAASRSSPSHIRLEAVCRDPTAAASNRFTRRPFRLALFHLVAPRLARATLPRGCTLSIPPDPPAVSPPAGNRLFTDSRPAALVIYWRLRALPFLTHLASRAGRCGIQKVPSLATLRADFDCCTRNCRRLMSAASLAMVAPQASSHSIEGVEISLRPDKEVNSGPATNGSAPPPLLPAFYWTTQYFGDCYVAVRACRRCTASFLPRVCSPTSREWYRDVPSREATI